jgi:LmbE family N-acetylglucosaminyl deacetylase
MRVLVVAPHMDDEVLGVGGAICRHIDAGDSVAVCIVANRAYGHRYDEAMIAEEREAAYKAKEVLGYQELHFLGLPDERLDAVLQDIIIPLEELYQRVRPEVVYVNHRGDNNQDHQAVFRAAMVVCRPYGGGHLRSLYAYEVPSSTDQAPPLLENAYLPNRYVDISPYLERKVAALRCYQRELRKFPHPRSPEGILTYAHKRGSEAGLEAAEAFMVLREVCR